MWVSAIRVSLAREPNLWYGNEAKLRPRTKSSVSIGRLRAQVANPPQKCALYTLTTTITYLLTYLLACLADWLNTEFELELVLVLVAVLARRRISSFSSFEQLRLLIVIGMKRDMARVKAWGTFNDNLTPKEHLTLLKLTNCCQNYNHPREYFYT